MINENLKEHRLFHLGEFCLPRIPAI